MNLNNNWIKEKIRENKRKEIQNKTNITWDEKIMLYCYTLSVNLMPF